MAKVVVGCGVFLAFLGLGHAESADSVEISLHGVSVRFDPAMAEILGLTYRAEIGSEPAAALNGELMPLLSHEPFTHGGYLRLTDAALPAPTTLALGLNIPPFEDQNQNGLHDFFETGMAVAGRTSEGACLDPIFGERQLRASWSRAAGEATGFCVLRFESLGLEFEHRFRLLEYRGRLTYTNTPARHFVGWLEATNLPAGGGTLAGAVEVLRVGQEGLDLKRGSLTNANRETLAFQLEQPLQRVGVHYLGFLIFDDGWLATPEPDYADFVLVIADPRDTNGNGVPDISEPVPPAPAHLSVSVREGAVWLTIEGTVGLAYSIETTSVLGTPWVEETVVMMEGPRETIRLTTPWSGGYWRAVVE